MCHRTVLAGAPRGHTIVGCVHSCHCVEERRSFVGAVVSSGVSLRDLTCGRCVARDIEKRRDREGGGGKMVITAASVAYLNNAVEPTAPMAAVWQAGGI